MIVGVNMYDMLRPFARWLIAIFRVKVYDMLGSQLLPAIVRVHVHDKLGSFVQLLIAMVRFMYMIC